METCAILALCAEGIYTVDVVKCNISRGCYFLRRLSVMSEFHVRRLARLALVGAHQILTSWELAADLCQGCADMVSNQEGHVDGCQTSLITIEDCIRKAELWTSTYVFNGRNTAPVHWEDLEILRPHIEETLVRHGWSLPSISVSTMFIFPLTFLVNHRFLQFPSPNYWFDFEYYNTNSLLQLKLRIQYISTVKNAGHFSSLDSELRGNHL